MANTFVAPYADFIDHDLVAENCSHVTKCVLNLDGCRKLQSTDITCTCTNGSVRLNAFGSGQRTEKSSSFSTINLHTRRQLAFGPQVNSPSSLYSSS